MSIKTLDDMIYDRNVIRKQIDAFEGIELERISKELGLRSFATFMQIWETHYRVLFSHKPAIFLST